MQTDNVHITNSIQSEAFRNINEWIILNKLINSRIVFADRFIESAQIYYVNWIVYYLIHIGLKQKVILQDHC